jgi:hypothetical protein
MDGVVIVLAAVFFGSIAGAFLGVWFGRFVARRWFS